MVFGKWIIAALKLLLSNYDTDNSPLDSILIIYSPSLIFYRETLLISDYEVEKS